MNFSSSLRMFGINHTLKACTPFETLQNEFDNDENEEHKITTPKCLPECKFVDYVANIRVNSLNKLNEYYADGDTSILILHYETFAYDIITEYHESLADFLCKAFVHI